MGERARGRTNVSCDASGIEAVSTSSVFKQILAIPICREVALRKNIGLVALSLVFSVAGAAGCMAFFTTIEVLDGRRELSDDLIVKVLFILATGLLALSIHVGARWCLPTLRRIERDNP